MKAKRLPRLKLGLLCLLLLQGFTSCTDEALMDRNEAITDNLWTDAQHPEFELDIDDPAAGYDVYLNLRNSAQFPFSKIYVLVHLEKEGQPRTSYRVGLKLADRDGLWTGKSAGNLYAHQALFLRNYHFPDSGQYRFVVESNMRLSPLPGISDVGLRISPARR